MPIAPTSSSGAVSEDGGNSGGIYLSGSSFRNWFRNNVAANVARDEIGSDTWLKLVSRPNDADLILDVAESQQVTTVLYTQIQITVRIQLKRPPTGDDELLWSGSESERIGGFGSATGKLLQRMTKELGCKGGYVVSE